MTYFCFDVLPLLAYFVREEFPHLLANVDVGFGQCFDFDAVPVFGAVPLLHEPFMALAAGVGGLVWEELGGNGLPIETLLASTHEQIVVLWRPGLGGMAI